MRFPRPLPAQVIVRQTGKLRGVLLEPGQKANLKAWNNAMYAALSAAGCSKWDYSLMTNQSEAALEGGSFYDLNDVCSLHACVTADTEVVGMAVGSSSTQAYSITQSGGPVSACFDTDLGCLPSRKQKAALAAGEMPKTSAGICEEFAAVLRPHFAPAAASGSPHKTLVVKNAMGYVVVALTQHEGLKANGPACLSELEARVKGALPISPAELLQWTTELQASASSPVRPSRPLSGSTPCHPPYHCI